MNRLWGTVIAVLLLLTACGRPPTSIPSVPAPELAPISTVSGVIPSEAGMYGMMTFGGGLKSKDEELMYYFAQPAFPFEFDDAGAFTVPLPMIFENKFSPDPALRACGGDDFAIIGLVVTSANVLTDPTPSGEVRGSFNQRHGDSAVTGAWYSSVGGHVRCHFERDSMSGSIPADYDLLLLAGWNQFTGYLRDNRVYYRTGAPSGLTWERLE